MKRVVWYCIYNMWCGSLKKWRGTFKRVLLLFKEVVWRFEDTGVLFCKNRSVLLVTGLNFIHTSPVLTLLDCGRRIWNECVTWCLDQVYIVLACSIIVWTKKTVMAHTWSIKFNHWKTNVYQNCFSIYLDVCHAYKTIIHRSVMQTTGTRKMQLHLIFSSTPLIIGVGSAFILAQHWMPIFKQTWVQCLLQVCVSIFF